MNINKQDKIVFLVAFVMLQTMSSQMKLVDVTLGNSSSNSLQGIGYHNSISSVLIDKNDLSSKRYGRDHDQRAKTNIIEVETKRKQEITFRTQVQKSINEALGEFSLSYKLPSHINKKGAFYYQKAFQNLKQMSGSSFSIRKAVFTVENAFYEEKDNYAEFEKVIKQTGNFLREKMNELGYDQSSNLAKNFILFQFFSDTLEIKSKKLKHLPLSYDFDDYSGKDDWTKMFVKKLLETGKGQCNSLPQLYLILAEEIGANASLALSPNHSYIKFQDDKKRKWYNVELTNGMLTTDAFILQSGYIKAEALQNKIYMQPLSKEQMLSQQFLNLASGYIHKYGYDEFINEVISYALELNPNNINAHLLKSNYNAFKLKYALDHLGITRDNFKEIKQYPFAIDLYKKTVNQYKLVDNLGYQKMPDAAYKNWLSSVNKKQNEQENQQLKSVLKTIIPIKQ